MNFYEIAPQSGVGFELLKGEELMVDTSQGEQVADLFCFSKSRPFDALSSGRSIDYNETVRFTVGHVLYANSGEPLLKISEDICGVHDFLVTPCSLQMFQMLSKNHEYHPSCHENLCKSFAKFDLPPHAVTTTFNIFMNYAIESDGKIILKAPINKPGEHITFCALKDLFVGLTACADPHTNGGVCKSVRYGIRKNI